MTKKSVTQSVPEAVKEFGPVWAVRQLVTVTKLTSIL